MYLILVISMCQQPQLWFFPRHISYICYILMLSLPHASILNYFCVSHSFRLWWENHISNLFSLNYCVQLKISTIYQELMWISALKHLISFIGCNKWVLGPWICPWFGESDGTPLQYSCLENPMNRQAWWAAVHQVSKSRTRLRDFTFTFHFQALEKEMATHSSVLAWRIPGTGEPGGLPSMGSHRVGHDWSDLAACPWFDP